MKKWQKLGHGEILVEVLLSEVNELREDKIVRTGQAANQYTPGKETSERRLWRASGAIAADQCEVGWLSKGNSALRGRKNKAKQGLIRDVLHLQWSPIKEGLSDGLEGVCVKHMHRSKKENIVDITCPECQSSCIAPRGSGERA